MSIPYRERPGPDLGKASQRPSGFTCGPAGAWKLLLFLPLICAFGCDAFSIHSFAGSILQFSVGGADITPPGKHLELWARNQYDDVVRVDPYWDLTGAQTAYGLMVRRAVGLDDPCLIDGSGNLLTSAAAYPTSVTIAGVTQTPEQQARQVRDRIAQLTPAGQQPLLTVLPYDPTSPPSLAADATAAERLVACNAYRSASELTYVGNPYQISAPLHGVTYGFLRFISTRPPTNYDGFRLDTPINLKGVRELFMTIEDSSVDPRNRGPLFLISAPTPGGQDVLQFDLIHADPNGTATGAVGVYFNLDVAPVQF